MQKKNTGSYVTAPCDGGDIDTQGADQGGF